MCNHGLARIQVGAVKIDYGDGATAVTIKQIEYVIDFNFKCFDCVSVSRAMASLKKAKDLGEPCPFTQGSLNELFGKTL